MATEVVTLLRDDLNGSTAERTVNFAWDGVNYEIDLSKKNIAELAALLEPYVAVARRSADRRRTGRPARSVRAASPRNQVDLAAVREWASANGHPVAARGRISTTVLDAYRAGTSDAPEAVRTRRPSVTRKRSAKA
jgi:hypothetical protein